jgi:hypothetical protein
MAAHALEDGIGKASFACRHATDFSKQYTVDVPILHAQKNVLRAFIQRMDDV